MRLFGPLLSSSSCFHFFPFILWQMQTSPHHKRPRQDGSNSVTSWKAAAGKILHTKGIEGTLTNAIFHLVCDPLCALPFSLSLSLISRWLSTMERFEITTIGLLLPFFAFFSLCRFDLGSSWGSLSFSPLFFCIGVLCFSFLSPTHFPTTLLWQINVPMLLSNWRITCWERRKKDVEIFYNLISGMWDMKTRCKFSIFLLPFFCKVDFPSSCLFSLLIRYPLTAAWYGIKQQRHVSFSSSSFSPLPEDYLHDGLVDQHVERRRRKKDLSTTPSSPYDIPLRLQISQRERERDVFLGFTMH